MCALRETEHWYLYLLQSTRLDLLHTINIVGRFGRHLINARMKFGAWRINQAKLSTQKTRGRRVFVYRPSTFIVNYIREANCWIMRLWNWHENYSQNITRNTRAGRSYIVDQTTTTHFYAHLVLPHIISPKAAWRVCGSRCKNLAAIVWHVMRLVVWQLCGCERETAISFQVWVE